jgi:hypothetical protein
MKRQTGSSANFMDAKWSQQHVTPQPNGHNSMSLHSQMVTKACHSTASISIRSSHLRRGNKTCLLAAVSPPTRSILSLLPPYVTHAPSCVTVVTSTNHDTVQILLSLSPTFPPLSSPVFPFSVTNQVSIQTSKRCLFSEWWETNRHTVLAKFRVFES